MTGSGSQREATTWQVVVTFEQARAIGACMR